MSKSRDNGIGFLGALSLLFIGLKLTKQIDWHWAWVLMPLWVVPAIILSIFGFIGLSAAVLICIEWLRGLFVGTKKAKKPPTTPPTKEDGPWKYWQSK